MDVQWPWLDTLKVSHLYEEDCEKDKEANQITGCVCISLSDCVLGVGMSSRRYAAD